MTPNERLERILAGRPVDRPPFAPAVYEHKAALIGLSPSEVARDADLLERAVSREIELYDPDFVTIGLDVYNVEVEALGGGILYPGSNDVPSIAGPCLEAGADWNRLRVPDPRRDGRMPLFLEAGRRIRKRHGGERLVRGAVSAPYSIACGLVGSAEMAMALLDRPDWVAGFLSFTTAVSKAYGRAFVEAGLGIVLFDSHASPPLVSPALYRTIVLPGARSVVGFFRDTLRLPLVPYILGGDTAPILEAILETGTNNVLCDFSADLDRFIRRLATEPVLLRANLDPRFLVSASPGEIENRALRLLAEGRRHPRFALGTGIVPYDLPPEKIRAARRALDARGPAD